ncbi:response regulator [Paenibacillus sp. TRM 82003]|nr:response regulator [Paenibacillus sp. TRM 82003]
MLKDILEKEGHTVVSEAANGIEAVEKYKAYRPDLVTMDLNMPDMGGLEAMERIIAADPKAKIVMCSSLGHRHLIVNAVHRGARDYILKPFHSTRVIEAVERALHPSIRAVAE